MDPIIEKYPFVRFGELNYAANPGIMYQREIGTFNYDEKYYQYYVSLEDTEIARKINKSRVNLSHKYSTAILDIGIGSGEFIKKSYIKTFGFDINPHGVDWLKKRRCFVNPYEHIPECIDGVTFWDTLEHIPNPHHLLDLFAPGTYVFISMPIFDDLLKVRSSKHYKPNEHLTYWSVNGLTTYMRDCNFSLLEISDQESLAGRESIFSFAFMKLSGKPSTILFGSDQM